MDLIDELQFVLSKIDIALLNKDALEEKFLGYVDLYLVALEDWQRNNAEILSAPEVKNIKDFSELAGELKSKHKELMDGSIKVRDEVGEELQSINMRAKGIRKYIDVLPERVSVTRGKKG